MTPEIYIERLPLIQRQLAGFIRREILNAHPAVTEKLAYGLPYFYCNGPMCYMNPKEWGESTWVFIME